MKKSLLSQALGAAMLAAAGLPVQAALDDLDMNGMCTNCVLNKGMLQITPPDAGGANGLLGYVSKWKYDEPATSNSRLRPNGLPGPQPASPPERLWCVNPYFKVIPSRASPAGPAAALTTPAGPLRGPVRAPAIAPASPSWTTPFTLWLDFAGGGPNVGLTSVPSGLRAGFDEPLRLRPAQCGRTVGGVLPALVFRTEAASFVSGQVTVEWAQNPWVDGPAGPALPMPPASASTR